MKKEKANEKIKEGRKVALIRQKDKWKREGELKRIKKKENSTNHGNC